MSEPDVSDTQQQSHLVIRQHVVLVDPSLVSVSTKGEREDTPSSLLRWFPSSDLPSQISQLAVCRAAGQQVGCGGSWGGAPPDV